MKKLLIFLSNLVMYLPNACLVLFLLALTLSFSAQTGANPVAPHWRILGLVVLVALKLAAVFITIKGMQSGSARNKTAAACLAAGAGLVYCMVLFAAAQWGKPLDFPLSSIASAWRCLGILLCATFACIACGLAFRWTASKTAA